MIWEEAAARLTNRQVKVSFTYLPCGINGLYDRDRDGLVVVVDAGLYPAEKLWVFLHECAHIRLGHADKLPVLTKARLDALPQSAWAAAADPTYHDRPPERSAAVMADLWLEGINEASWPGPWGPELKLGHWLKQAAPSTTKSLGIPKAYCCNDKAFSVPVMGGNYGNK